MPRLDRRRLLRATAAALTAGVAGCLLDVRPDEGADPPDGVAPTTVVSGLDVPWDLAVAGDDAFVTERDGGVRRFDRESLVDGSDLAAGDGEVALAGADLPERTAPGEGGTLGVAAHPDYPEPPAIYVYYTAEDGARRNRVVRYDRDRDVLEPIVEGIPAARTHNGGRLRFGPDGDLWVLTGDAEDPDAARDPDSLAGSVLRLTPEGDPAAPGPPFPDGDPRLFTVGHRNPQGLAFAPDGTAFAAEHGPDARDEVSLLRSGGNYGWDVARGGPDDPEYDGYGAHEEFVPPLLNTGPETTWAPSGIARYDGPISEWDGRLLVAGLASETLFAVALLEDAAADDLPNADVATVHDDDWLEDRYTAVSVPYYVGEFGRLRHVAVGPDGALYLLTSNRDGRTRAGSDFPRDDDDRIVRLERT